MLQLRGIGKSEQLSVNLSSVAQATSLSATTLIQWRQQILVASGNSLDLFCCCVAV